MALSLSLTPVLAADFSDTDGHWGATSVGRWADAGVLTGGGSGSFLPDKEMTRAEFAQMLCNLMGYTEKTPNNPVSAPEGVKVYVGFSSPEGKEVQTVSFTPEGGREQTIEPDSNGEYAFIMPAADVTVKVIFVEKTPETT